MDDLVQTSPPILVQPKGVRFRRVVLGLILFVDAGVMVVTVRRSKIERHKKECQEWLIKIDGAKEQWALENNKTPGSLVTEEDINPDPALPGNSHICFYSPIPECPSGKGHYVIGAIGKPVICTSGLPGHNMSEIGVAITVQ